MAFFQEPPALGNVYVEDKVLRSFLRRNVPAEVLADIEPSLNEMGELAAGPLWDLALRYRQHEPQHIPYDPWGHRVDEVTVNRAWEEYARVAATRGLIATAYERKHGPYSRLHQFSLVYLFDGSSQTYTCPLAMTDGCARTLEVLAKPELRDEVLPHLVSRDPAQAWTSGQWMTERTGGSDVGLSETVARQEGGTWRLYGTKWFTSAVTSQVALTLARPEGNPEGGRGLALFLVRVRDDGGHLNGIMVNRLKEKLGTKNLPTAELTLNGAEAIPVEELSNGIRNMRFMLNLTRTWNAVSSAGALMRGLALARAYAHKRVAFGSPLSEKPLHLDTLAQVAAEHQAALHLVFNNIAMVGRTETGEASEQDEILLRVLQPIAKLLTAKQAVNGAQEVIESFGGAGYIEDTGLPTLMRDTHVLPIWEGTTNVLSLESFRALQRTNGLGPLVELVNQRTAQAEHDLLREPAQAARRAAERAAQWLSATSADRPALEAGARRCAMTLGRAAALALLVDHAAWSLREEQDPVAAYAAQRFAQQGVDLLGTAPSLEASKALALGRA